MRSAALGEEGVHKWAKKHGSWPYGLIAENKEKLPDKTESWFAINWYFTPGHNKLRPWGQKLAVVKQSYPKKEREIVEKLTVNFTLYLKVSEKLLASHK